MPSESPLAFLPALPRRHHLWALCGALLFFFLLFLPACARSGSAGEVEDPRPVPAAPDLAQGDLAAGPDLATADLSAPPDLGPVCTVVPQAGCPAGQKCTTQDGTSAVCDPAGVAPRGSLCSWSGSTDTCAEGSRCFTEAPGVSICRSFCTNDAHCGTRSYCDIEVGSSRQFRLCTQPCEPVFPGSGCPLGLGCFAYSAEHTDCAEAGLGNEGSICAQITDCKSGMLCINSRCRHVCNRADGAGCLATRFCDDVYYNGSRWVRYGVCCPFTGC